MAKQPKKTVKSGSTYAGGKTALSFKKGTPNYMETPKKVNTAKDPLRSRPQQKKPIDPNQQNRSSGESIQDFMKRRNANRSK